ncbi:MAG: response regulator [Candidatus Eisenbacteria bacterium]
MAGPPADPESEAGGDVLETADKASILVVDDLPANQLVYQSVLEELGQNLIMARSGREALRQVLQRDFALIILDVNMPDMSGFETAALIRQRKRAMHTPIMFITAYADVIQSAEGYALGAVDFITSPVIPDVLRSKVRAFVELDRMRAVLAQSHQLLEQRVAERTARLQEINQRLHAEVAERRRAEEALREAGRHKDEFLAMLAHELRNPLAPIRNAVNVLQLLGPVDLDATRLEWVRSLIGRQVDQLSRLVDDLLDVSRISRGKISLQKEPVELAAIVERAIETSRPLIDEREHELSVVLPPEPVLLDADLARLAQALGNLLNNAAKYTEDGGRIQLTASRANDRMVFQVTDNGVGIPPSILPYVFDLFTQGDRALDRSQGGLGIGLALVKNIVELHGGQVEARSAGAGQGSTFYLRLPAPASPAAAETVVEQRAPASRGPARRVLVVDDNIDSAESMAMLLRLEGHQTHTALDGAAALAATEEFQPDLILLDIGLPNLDGYAVARRLRGMRSMDRTVLVAMTGYGLERDQRRSREAGFDHHMIKPLDVAVLRQVLVSCPGAEDSAHQPGPSGTDNGAASDRDAVSGSEADRPPARGGPPSGQRDGHGG